MKEHMEKFLCIEWKDDIGEVYKDYFINQSDENMMIVSLSKNKNTFCVSESVYDSDIYMGLESILISILGTECSVPRIYLDKCGKFITGEFFYEIKSKNST